MHILIVQENQNQQYLKSLLDPENYCVEVSSIEDALEYARAYDYDVVLFDLDETIDKAIHLLHEFEKHRINVSKIVISSVSNVETKVTVLDAGADDYLQKPYHGQELLVRLHAIVRRAKGHAVSTVEVGKLSIDLRSKLVWVNGDKLNLSSMEYEILESMALRKGEVLPKQLLVDHVYGEGVAPVSNVIQVMVGHLRRKIAARNDGESYIQTLRGQGLMLAAHP